MVVYKPWTWLRKLNEITKPDAFPMRLPTDLIYKVVKVQYISLLGMLRGYCQISLHEHAQAHTTYVTHVGQYALKVMPFGLRNSARTYHTAITQILI